jgi:hypothetical protein
VSVPIDRRKLVLKVLIVGEVLLKHEDSLLHMLRDDDAGGLGDNYAG